MENRALLGFNGRCSEHDPNTKRAMHRIAEKRFNALQVGLK